MAKSRSPRDSMHPGPRLADALAPHIEQLEASLATTPEPAIARPIEVVSMTAGQLMQLAFELVGREGELVLDWARIEIVEASPVAHGGASTDSGALDTPTGNQAGTGGPRDRTTDDHDGEPATHALRQHAWSGAQWRDEGTQHEPRSPMDPTTLGRRLRRASCVPTLRLRGLDRQGARRQLEDFVVLARHGDLRVIRVVTGKGLGSRGDPVLRPMLARWLATQAGRVVSGWRYDVDVDGEWGSVLIVLQPRSR